MSKTLVKNIKLFVVGARQSLKLFGQKNLFSWN